MVGGELCVFLLPWVEAQAEGSEEACSSLS
jgi:hypothetical protein